MMRINPPSIHRATRRIGYSSFRNFCKAAPPNPRFIDKIVAQRKYLDAFWDLCMFYWRASKQLYSELAEAYQIRRQLPRSAWNPSQRVDPAQWAAVTRAQWRSYRLAREGGRRVVFPFSVMVMLPAAYIVIPWVAYSRPFDLPSVFLTPEQKKIVHKNHIRIVNEEAQIVRNLFDVPSVNQYAFDEWIEKALPEFKWRKLEDMPRKNLKKLCSLLNLRPYAPLAELKRAAFKLRVDAFLLRREGLASLSGPVCLAEACLERGISVDCSEHAQRARLARWVALASRENVPESLLLAQGAFLSELIPEIEPAILPKPPAFPGTPGTSVGIEVKASGPVGGEQLASEIRQNFREIQKTSRRKQLEERTIALKQSSSTHQKQKIKKSQEKSNDVPEISMSAPANTTKPFATITEMSSSVTQNVDDVQKLVKNTKGMSQHITSRVNGSGAISGKKLSKVNQKRQNNPIPSGKSSRSEKYVKTASKLEDINIVSRSSKVETGDNTKASSNLTAIAYKMAIATTKHDSVTKVVSTGTSATKALTVKSATAMPKKISKADPKSISTMKNKSVTKVQSTGSNVSRATNVSPIKTAKTLFETSYKNEPAAKISTKNAMPTSKVSTGKNVTASLKKPIQPDTSTIKTTDNAASVKVVSAAKSATSPPKLKQKRKKRSTARFQITKSFSTQRETIPSPQSNNEPVEGWKELEGRLENIDGHVKKSPNGLGDDVIALKFNHMMESQDKRDVKHWQMESEKSHSGKTAEEIEEIRKLKEKNRLEEQKVQEKFRKMYGERLVREKQEFAQKLQETRTSNRNRSRQKLARAERFANLDRLSSVVESLHENPEEVSDQSMDFSDEEYMAGHAIPSVGEHKPEERTDIESEKQSDQTHSEDTDGSFASDLRAAAASVEETFKPKKKKKRASGYLLYWRECGRARKFSELPKDEREVYNERALVEL
eukprot:141810_1